MNLISLGAGLMRKLRLTRKSREKLRVKELLSIKRLEKLSRLTFTREDPKSVILKNSKPSFQAI
jgi:hypothetical protein